MYCLRLKKINGITIETGDFIRVRKTDGEVLLSTKTTRADKYDDIEIYEV